MNNNSLKYIHHTNILKNNEILKNKKENIIIIDDKNDLNEKYIPKITRIVKIMRILKKLRKYQLQKIHLLFCSSKKYNNNIKLTDMIIEKEIREEYLLKIKNMLYTFDDNTLDEILNELIY